MHDKGYDALHAKSANSLFGDWCTTPVDETALNGWNDFLANSNVGSVDPLNRQKVNQKERDVAWQGATLFKNVVGNKKWEIASFMQQNYKEASQGTKSMKSRSFSKNEVQANCQLFSNKYMNKDNDGNWIREAGMWSEDKDHNFIPKNN